MTKPLSVTIGMTIDRTQASIHIDSLKKIPRAELGNGSYENLRNAKEVIISDRKYALAWVGHKARLTADQPKPRSPLSSFAHTIKRIFKHGTTTPRSKRTEKYLSKLIRKADKGLAADHAKAIMTKLCESPAWDGLISQKEFTSIKKGSIEARNQLVTDFLAATFNIAIEHNPAYLKRDPLACREHMNRVHDHLANEMVKGKAGSRIIQDTILSNFDLAATSKILDDIAENSDDANTVLFELRCLHLFTDKVILKKMQDWVEKTCQDKLTWAGFLTCADTIDTLDLSAETKSNLKSLRLLHQAYLGNS